MTKISEIFAFPKKHPKITTAFITGVAISIPNICSLSIHHQIKSGQKPPGIFPKCVKNFTSSNDHPPELRPIACSPDTTNIQITNQNARRIAEGIIGQKATAKYGVQPGENYPAQNVSINLNFAQIARMQEGTRTPYSLFQGDFMNNPRIKQYIATFGQGLNRAFCTEINPINNNNNSPINQWYIGMLGARSSAVFEGAQTYLQKIKGLLDNKESNNTKSTVCFVEPSGHGLSGIHTDSNGKIIAFSPSSTEDATLEWSQNFQDFMQKFVLKKDNQNIRLHVFGQSTSALSVFHGLAALKAQKAIGIKNVESLSLVSPLVKPRQVLANIAFVAGPFFFYSKTAFPWQTIWQKPLDFSSSWEVQTKQPIPLALIFREGLTPQLVPSKVQVEKTQASAETIFQSIQENKFGCVAQNIQVLKADNDDVVDNQSIVDLHLAFKLKGCPTTIFQSPKTAHNFAITSPNELVSHW